MFEKEEDGRSVQEDERDIEKHPCAKSEERK